jgi:small subunit ribosomal protein S20
MPQKHAAMKDLRKNKKHAAQNERVKRNVRHLLKKSEELLKEGKTAEAKTAILAFQQAVDKATKTGAVSKNKASRKKSVLMKALQKK